MTLAVAGPGGFQYPFLENFATELIPLKTRTLAAIRMRASMAIFTSLLFDFLADVLRRAAYHQSGNEDGQNGEQQHPLDTGSDSAKNDFAELNVKKRHQAADGCGAIVLAVDGAAARVRGHHRKQRRRRDSEAHLFTLHVAAWLHGGGLGSSPSFESCGLPDCSAG